VRRFRTLRVPFQRKNRPGHRDDAQLRVQLWTVDESRKGGRWLMIPASSSSLSDLDRGLTDGGGDASPEDGFSRDDLAGGRQLSTDQLRDTLWVLRDDVRRTVAQWERVPPTPSALRIPQSVPFRVPSVPVSALPPTRPADDNRLASSAI
jgi:hypothetical protein